MSSSLSNSLLILSVLLGTLGIVLVIQANFQIRMLRQRVSTGIGSAVIDPVTGLFAPSTIWQGIRSEANRSRRLKLPFYIWVAKASSKDNLEENGRLISENTPIRTTCVRLDDYTLCLLSCTEIDPRPIANSLEWKHKSFPSNENNIVQNALDFIAEEQGD